MQRGLHKKGDQETSVNCGISKRFTSFPLLIFWRIPFFTTKILLQGCNTSRKKNIQKKKTKIKKISLISNTIFYLSLKSLGRNTKFRLKVGRKLLKTTGFFSYGSFYLQLLQCKLNAPYIVRLGLQSHKFVIE